MITHKEKQEMLEEKIKTDARAGNLIFGADKRFLGLKKKPQKEISNLLCPKCKKTITDSDLKHWKCSKCKTSFRVTFVKPQKKDKVFVWVKNSTNNKYKLVWQTK